MTKAPVGAAVGNVASPARQVAHCTLAHCTLATNSITAWQPLMVRGWVTGLAGAVQAGSTAAAFPTCSYVYRSAGQRNHMKSNVLYVLGRRMFAILALPTSACTRSLHWMLMQADVTLHLLHLASSHGFTYAYRLSCVFALAAADVWLVPGYAAAAVPAAWLGPVPALHCSQHGNSSEMLEWLQQLYVHFEGS